MFPFFEERSDAEFQQLSPDAKTYVNGEDFATMCYHQACDSFSPVADGANAGLYAQLNAEYELIGNVNTEVLDTNSDAIAPAVITYAFDTSSVNGESSPGKSYGSGKSAEVVGRHGDVAR